MISTNVSPHFNHKSSLNEFNFFRAVSFQNISTYYCMCQLPRCVVTILAKYFHSSRWSRQHVVWAFHTFLFMSSCLHYLDIEWNLLAIEFLKIIFICTLQIVFRSVITPLSALHCSQLLSKSFGFNLYGCI